MFTQKIIALRSAANTYRLFISIAAMMMYVNASQTTYSPPLRDDIFIDRWMDLIFYLIPLVMLAVAVSVVVSYVFDLRRKRSTNNNA